MKYLLSCIFAFGIIGGFALAYEATPALDNKIDTAADAIMDLMVSRSEKFGDNVIVLLKGYEIKFANEGNERNQYIAWRLIVQLEPFHKCTTVGGTRLTVVNECEYVSETRCDEMEGTFHECGSACRHEEEGTICTLQCVPYCDMELDYMGANSSSEQGTGSDMGTGDSM